MNRPIEERLENVARRYRRLYRRRTASWVLGAATFFGLLLWLSRDIWTASAPWIVLVWCIATAGALHQTRRIVRRMGRNPRWVARRIEAAVPQLDSRLITAVDLETRTSGEKRSFLHHRLMEEVMSIAWRTDWDATVPADQLRSARGMQITAVAAFTVVLAALLASPGSVLRRMAGIDSAPDRRLGFSFEVDPGDAEVERGAGLLILARFEGPVPDEVSLLLSGASGSTDELLMTRSLDDPVYGVRIPRVDESARYVVACGEERAGPYTISVFEPPRLIRADARLDYPDYTGLDAKTIVDVRRVTALEGSELTWTLHLNKPVAEARLIDKEGNAFPLSQGERDGIMLGSLRLDESRRYRLHLTDAEGRENKTPPELIVRVMPNRPPDIKWVSPGRDVRASALEELRLAATVRDDVGLHRYGVTYARAGDDPHDIELGSGNGRSERYAGEHVLALEDLGVQPNQLVSFYFWAEDTGPNGEPRRGFSDMYFAEIRPFEEIFREGQPQPGGADQSQRQDGGAARAEELVELQKQIVSGTWNLLRGSGDDVAEQSGVLLDAQRSVQLQAQALEAELSEPESLADLETVVGHMGEAATHLSDAAEEATSAPLSPALTEEQSAYQGLLRLQAREFSVTQNAGNPGAAGSARGSRSRLQRQLQELELTNDRNRYETQRTAQDETEGRSENQEAFDRLRDLARRQSDLNARLKELQSALAEAATKEEERKIRDELKRLRDEQQEILRDTDALAEQMRQQQNEERMADARQQLEDTRSNVRRASEALDEGQVSRAAAEGTRAEESFRELREEFRRRSARQFSQEMDQLRADARSLADQQQQVGERLSDLGQDGSSSLRGETGRYDVASQLEDQQVRLADLLDAVRDVVDQAEEAEPLLAETLYDAVREAQLARTEDALDATRRLLEAGFPLDAAQAEAVAGEGIRSLRDDIETAAEQVLGDGVEALRRAREALAQLASEAEAEVERAAAPDVGEAAAGAGRPQPDAEGSDREPGIADGGGQDGRPGAAPFGGDDYREWSNRLGDVEDMMDDPDLQARAARIREQARQLRSGARRESREPSWDLVQLTVIEPMHDLQDRIIEEISRRGSRDALVPIDADPVPPAFAEQVRKYYERLGSGE